MSTEGGRAQVLFGELADLFTEYVETVEEARKAYHNSTLWRSDVALGEESKSYDDLLEEIEQKAWDPIHD